MATNLHDKSRFMDISGGDLKHYSSLDHNE